MDFRHLVAILVLVPAIICDMFSEMQRFCTCWRSYAICNGTVLDQDIILKDCPRKWKWERGNSHVTNFKVDVEFLPDGNILKNKIACNRRKRFCKFSTSVPQEQKVRIQIVSVARDFTCSPVSRKLSCDNKFLKHNFVPRPPTSDNNKTDIIFLVSVAVIFVTICVVLFVCCIRKRQRLKDKCHRVGDRLKLFMCTASSRETTQISNNQEINSPSAEDALVQLNFSNHTINVDNT